MHNPGFYQPSPDRVREQFLDHEQRVRVATPEEFVGRRRILQSGLRSLRQPNKIGVVLHGLGGVGKSTVAARLLERLPDYEPLVIYQGLDSAKLEQMLYKRCKSISPLGLEILNGLNELNEPLPLVHRLRNFLDRGLNDPKRCLIFVLDDFEVNLEARSDGAQVLRAEVVEVVTQLLQAVWDSEGPHRILITSCYDVQFPELNDRLERIPLASLRGADLQKKCDRLEAFQTQSGVAEALQAQAKTLADGNPRLLEWLDKVLRDEQTEQQAILDAMAETAQEFRESILAEMLLGQQSVDLKQVLTRMQMFELPVPKSAIAAVTKQMANLEEHLQRAIAVGLVESVLSGGEWLYRLYRLPRILTPLLEPIEEQELYRLGLDELYRLWWAGKDKYTEKQAIELFRLAELAKADEVLIELGVALGHQWNDEGRYREGIEKFKSVLGIRQKLLGQEHPSVASSLNNLAALYENQGRYEEAEPLYIQALQMRQKLLGQEHPSVAISQCNLGVFYQRQGKYDEARALYHQAIAIAQATLGTNHPNTQTMIDWLNSLPE